MIHTPFSLLKCGWALGAAVALCLLQASSARALDPGGGWELDQYGGVLSIQGEATGWFHVEEIDGRWYFITPEGHGMVSLGVTHAVETMDRDELGLFESRYEKSEPKLAEFFIEQFKSWGFNSSGYGAMPTFEQRIPFPAVIWTEGPRSFSLGPNNGSFSDVYDPAVQERLRQLVRRRAARYVNNRYCLGYMFIDLPIWHLSVETRETAPNYVDFMRDLGPEGAGKKAYVEFLREKYGDDIAAVNAAYGIEAESFDSLLQGNPLDGAEKNAAITTDDEEFLNRIADTYYTVVTTELRKADPNHLILGDKFMAEADRTHDSILRTAAKYVDAMSFQPMGTAVMHKDYWNHVNELTGKPIVLADTDTTARELSPQKDQADTSEYETKTGENTYAYYTNTMESPAVIGIHRCTVRDLEIWKPRTWRAGLLKADDTPYPIMSDYARKTSMAIYTMAYGEPRGDAGEE